MKKKIYNEKKKLVQNLDGYCPLSRLGAGQTWARSRSAGTARWAQQARAGGAGRAQVGTGWTGAGRHGACVLGVLGARGRRA